MVVRWRDNGAQRARRFKTQPKALAFDEGVSDGAVRPRSSTPNVYPLRDVGRDALALQLPRLARARVEQARLETERAAARDREERMGQVRQGGVYVSR
jgi:hypothetical protein